MLQTLKMNCVRVKHAGAATITYDKKQIRKREETGAYLKCRVFGLPKVCTHIIAGKPPSSPFKLTIPPTTRIPIEYMYDVSSAK